MTEREDAPVTREEYERLEKQVEAMSHQLGEMYRALMEAQPGYDKPLIQRVAKLAVDVEGGVRSAKLVVAVIAALAILGITTRFGVQMPSVAEIGSNAP